MVNLEGFFVVWISIFVHLPQFIISIPVSSPALSIMQKQRPGPGLQNYKNMSVPLGFLMH